MHDHLLHRGRKHFCLYCLHAFITEEILKLHLNPIQDGHFQCCSRIWEWAKSATSLISVAHILK